MQRAFYYLKRWAWLLTLCPLLAAGITLVLALVRPPVYEATVNVVFGLANPTNPSALSPDVAAQLGKTYTIILESPQILQEAAAQLGLQETTQQLSSQVDATYQSGTNIITLTADASSSALATRLADAVASAFRQAVQQVSPIGTHLVAWGSAQINPVKQKGITLSTAGIAIPLGLLVALSFVALLYYRDDTIFAPDGVPCAFDPRGRQSGKNARNAGVELSAMQLATTLPKKTMPARFFLGTLSACGIATVAALGAIFGALTMCALLALGWVAVLIWARPQWAAYLLAVTFPLTASIVRLPQIANLRPNELLLFLVFVLLLLRLLALRLPLPRFTWFDAAALALILGGTVIPLAALYGRGQPLESDTLIAALGPIKNYMIFLTLRLALSQVDHIRRTLAIILLTSGIVSLIGIAQALRVSYIVHFLLTYYPTVQVLDSAQTTLRITSVIGGWNDLASYLCFVLLISIAVATTRISIVPGFLFKGVVALDIVALLLTGSLASILGLIAGFCILGVYFGKNSQILRLLALVGLSVLGAALIFAPLLILRLQDQFGGGNQGIIAQSLVYRLHLWQTYFLPAIAHQPLLGVGLVIPASIPWTTTDSGYLDLLFTGGVLYLLCYIYFTWCCLRGTRQLLKRSLLSALAPAGADAVAAALAASGLTIVLILLGMNVSEAYFTYTLAASVFWMVLAAAVTVSPSPGASSITGKTWSC
ncbi:MAG TPA: O-antigen ligase family protein [Ktedonobacterales bacterium]|jgi:capsular polysaccharide biosynthesis protein